MPYITEEDRDTVSKHGPSNVGELTYVFYRIAVNYLPDDARYADYAEVMAALENTKQEFYRRMVVPYEDVKIIQNGDVT